MVVKCSVIVPFVEFVQTQRKTAPDNPSFEIGLVVFKNQVVGEAETMPANLLCPIHGRALCLKPCAKPPLQCANYCMKTCGVKKPWN